jgi:hypothetical protein
MKGKSKFSSGILGELTTAANAIERWVSRTEF